MLEESIKAEIQVLKTILTSLPYGVVLFIICISALTAINSITQFSYNSMEFGTLSAIVFLVILSVDLLMSKLVKVKNIPITPAMVVLIVTVFVLAIPSYFIYCGILELNKKWKCKTDKCKLENFPSTITGQVENLIHTVKPSYVGC